MSFSSLQFPSFDFDSLSDHLLDYALKVNDDSVVHQYIDLLKQKLHDLEIQIICQQLKNNPVWDFYPTPQSVIDRMFEFVPSCSNLKALEPSAGLGAISLALRAKNIECDCFELSPLLQSALCKMGFRVLGSDFLAATGMAVYDLVIANPPFSNLGVMKHTLHAMDFLKPGGRLITLAHHYTLSPSHKDRFFFSWLKTFNANIIDLGRPFADAERQTNIPINLIVIDKPSF
jgi:hypothetical protein